MSNFLHAHVREEVVQKVVQHNWTKTDQEKALVRLTYVSGLFQSSVMDVFSSAKMVEIADDTFTVHLRDNAVFQFDPNSQFGNFFRLITLPRLKEIQFNGFTKVAEILDFFDGQMAANQNASVSATGRDCPLEMVTFSKCVAEELNQELQTRLHNFLRKLEHLKKLVMPLPLYSKLFPDGIAIPTLVISCLSEVDSELPFRVSCDEFVLDTFTAAVGLSQFLKKVADVASTPIRRLVVNWCPWNRRYSFTKDIQGIADAFPNLHNLTFNLQSIPGKWCILDSVSEVNLEAEMYFANIDKKVQSVPFPVIVKCHQRLWSDRHVLIFRLGHKT